VAPSHEEVHPRTPLKWEVQVGLSGIPDRILKKIDMSAIPDSNSPIISIADITK
jgi:hypothetical protein